MKLSKEMIYFLSATMYSIGAVSFVLSLIYIDTKFYISFEFLSMSKLSFDFSLLVDFYSLFFCASVSFISGSVIFYSYNYMFMEKFFFRFHYILMSFVASMLALIFGVNMISIILGWDGLGVTSYLLVIYYQSGKSYNAGMLTALSNRVGDVFIMISCAMSMTSESMNFYLNTLSESSVWYKFILFLILASFTKSAQIPFSAWLPAAMAAPTPVSALVHSSTLVTAGVYLMFRFHHIFFFCGLKTLVLVIGILTLLMAGLSAMQEMDMKKVVALSTLSQLGLMMTALGAGVMEVAYFHLNTHAFMKALLFISMGCIIHNSNDYQDIRKSTLLVQSLPVSSGFMVISNVGLSGFPFIAGFYSKDMWLEATVSMINLSLVVYLMFYLSLMLTVIYSARLIMYITVFSLSKSFAFTQVVDDGVHPMVAMGVLWMLSVTSGSVFSWLSFKTPALLFLSLEVKNLTLVILSLSTVLAVSMYLVNKKVSPSWVVFFMWGLPFFISEKFIIFSMLTGKLSRLSGLSLPESVFMHKFDTGQILKVLNDAKVIELLKYSVVLAILFI